MRSNTLFSSKRALLLAATLCVSYLTSVSHSQTVVWSDDFESYTPQTFADAGTIGDWTEDGGSRPTYIDGLSANNGQNSLRLEEGPGGDTNGDGMLDEDDNDGAGSFVALDFPETYTSGAYSLKFSQYVEGSTDSLSRIYVSQEPYPEPSTGLDLFYDSQGLFLQFEDGTPAPVVIPWQVNESGEDVTVWNENEMGEFTVNPLLFLNEWVDQEINVDLDNNTFEWIYGDQTIVSYGTRMWDSDSTDGVGPALSSMVLVIAASNSDANSDGVTGSIFYDDFVLTEVVPGSSSLVCDANGDTGCDLADLDLLYQAFGETGALDLDNSGTVDSADINVWLTSASASNNPAKADPAHQYIVGDTDLDGSVSSGDLGRLLNNFGSAGGVGWNGGDLDGDGNVSSGDLGFLLNNFGATSQAVATLVAVPEPSSATMLFVALLGFSVIRRRA